jgi:hypothetical protein
LLGDIGKIRVPGHEASDAFVGVRRFGTILRPSAFFTTCATRRSSRSNVRSPIRLGAEPAVYSASAVAKDFFADLARQAEEYLQEVEALTGNR